MVKKKKEEEKKPTPPPKPRGLRVEPAEAPTKYSIGGVQMSKEEFDIAQRLIKAGGVPAGQEGFVSPGVSEAVKGREKFRVGAAPAADKEKLRELIQPSEEERTDEEIRNLALTPEGRAQLQREAQEERLARVEELREQPGIAGALGIDPEAPIDIAGGLQAAAGGLGAAAIPALISVGSGLSLAVTKDALAARVAQNGILKSLTAKTGAITAKSGLLSKGLIASALGVFGVSKIIGIPRARLQSIDTALGQIRETITAPVAAVRNGAITHSEGLDILDDLESSINEYERSLQELSISVRATTLNREQLDSALIRVTKLRQFIAVGRQDILLSAAAPTPPNQESLAIMLDELKRGT